MEIDKVVTAVITALLTVPLTVWLSLRRFYTEKLWEKTLDAYVKIIEALHHLGRPYDEAIDALEGGRDEPKQDELWKRSREARADILKQIDMGELLISEEAVMVLRDLMRELRKADSTQLWSDYLNANALMITQCLEQLKLLAVQDLRVSRGSWLPGPLRRIRLWFVRRSLSHFERLSAPPAA